MGIKHEVKDRRKLRLKEHWRGKLEEAKRALADAKPGYPEEAQALNAVEHARLMLRRAEDGTLREDPTP